MTAEELRIVEIHGNIERLTAQAEALREITVALLDLLDSACEERPDLPN